MISKILLFLLFVSLLVGTSLASDTLSPTVLPSVRLVGSGDAVVSGTASDATGDDGTVSGIQRVEIKLDSYGWVTASGTTTFNYNLSNLVVGNHIVGIRAFDLSNNPSDIVYLDFYVDSDYDTSTDNDDDDLSWYVSIGDLHFETMDTTFGVLKVEEGTDVGINFDIENDFWDDRKIRYSIVKGSYEVENDIIVDAEDDESVEEWIPGTYLTVGTHRFDIVLEDWETKDTVAEKSISLTVVDKGTLQVSDVTTSLSSSDSLIPDWFIPIAEENGIKITTSDDPDIEALEKQLDDQNTAITDLKTSISDLSNAVSKINTGTSTEPVSTTVQKNSIDEYWWLILMFLGGLGWWKRKELKLVPDDSAKNFHDARYIEQSPVNGHVLEEDYRT